MSAALEAHEAWNARLHERFHKLACGVLELAVNGRRADAEQALRAPDFVRVQRELSAALGPSAADVHADLR
jgi:hypothetical protein